MKNNLKLNLIMLCLMIFSVGAIGQAKVQEEPFKLKGSDFHFQLAILMILLLIPLVTSASTFIKLAKRSFEKKYGNPSNQKLSGFSWLSAGLGTETLSQVATPFDWSSVDWGLWVMLFVTVIEIFLIAFFNIQIKNILSLEDPVKSYPKSKHKESWFGKWWNKINNFKPISEETSIDTGHDYDGIRELNNITPPWFTIAFLATILFAGVYLYRYHWIKSAPLQMQELKMEMDAALKAKMEYMATQENNIDENNVTFMDEASRLEGQLIFETKCAVCHEKHGGSKPGGVGPNLTDKYWLHGGSIKDIFYTIKYGWPEKGMISWSDQMSALEMAKVSSFIKALQGTNPPAAKEAQGELFVEQEIKASTEKQDTSSQK